MAFHKLGINILSASAECVKTFFVDFKSHELYEIFVFKQNRMKIASYMNQLGHNPSSTVNSFFARLFFVLS